MRTHVFRPLFRVAVLLLCSACQQRHPPPLPESQFAFRGILLLRGTSTLDWEATDSLAVVRIQDVFLAPPQLPELRDSLVTVQLKDPGRARVGEVRVFFTRLLRVGESIVVVESGSLEGKEAEDVRTLRERIRRDQERKARVARKQWMTGADRVIRARVAGIRDAGPDEFPGWMRPLVEVRLAVARTYKGPRADTITAWYRVPDSASGGGPTPPGMGSLRPGWDGIFLLQVPANASTEGGDNPAGKGKAAGPLAIVRRFEAEKDILADLKSLP